MTQRPTLLSIRILRCCQHLLECIPFSFWLYLQTLCRVAMVSVPASPIGIQSSSSHLHHLGDLSFTGKISCHQPVQSDVTQHAVPEQNRQAREGSVGPNHLQRLAERQINNGNYFKTNWKQKAQPSSATARQKGKPQKEEIAALSVLSTLVSSSRQILIYLSCSPKSSSKNSQFRDIFFYLS